LFANRFPKIAVFDAASLLDAPFDGVQHGRKPRRAGKNQPFKLLFVPRRQHRFRLAVPCRFYIARYS
jgi:hypothetical protein